MITISKLELCTMREVERMKPPSSIVVVVVYIVTVVVVTVILLLFLLLLFCWAFLSYALCKCNK